MTTIMRIYTSIRLSCQKGVTAIEFAVVFPFVLAMTFAIVEIGWVMFSIYQVINVANEISREKSLNSLSLLTNNIIQNSVIEKTGSQSWYTIDSENFTISIPTYVETIDGFVTFQLEYKLESLFIGSKTLLDVNWSTFNYDILIPGTLAGR